MGVVGHHSLPNGETTSELEIQSSRCERVTAEKPEKELAWPVTPGSQKRPMQCRGADSAAPQKMLLL